MNDLALIFGVGMFVGVAIVWVLDAVLAQYYDASDEVDS
jgi:hypothetical protein